MSQQEVLATVVRVLEEAGIPYMLTGSVASSLQGEPRSTHDIDVVVALGEADVPALLRAFPSPDYYLDETTVRDAIRRQATFNVLDNREGTKIDFWLLSDEPFDRSRFSRRYIQPLHGIPLQVSSPEDTILAKLNWAQESGGSEKQFTDALRVYELQSPKLDEAYLARWAKALGVESLWERLKSEASAP